MEAINFPAVTFSPVLTLIDFSVPPTLKLKFVSIPAFEFPDKIQIHLSIKDVKKIFTGKNEK